MDKSEDASALLAPRAKLAVTVLLPSIFNMTGLVVALKSPLQLLNVYPELGAAVSVTTSP